MTNATIQTYSTMWKTWDQNGHWRRHTDNLPAVTADTGWINKDGWHLETKVVQLIRASTTMRKYLTMV
jgi:hypothetical protein